MTLKIFNLKVRFLITSALGRTFFAKNWRNTKSCAEAHKTLNFRVSTFSVPSGSRADLHPRPEGPSLRMDGMGWMDAISKVSFKFLYTLWVYRTCIYLLIYIVLKKFHQNSYGFQNFMSSWGFLIFFQNYPMYVCFWKIMVKVWDFRW